VTMDYFVHFMNEEEVDLGLVCEAATGLRACNASPQMVGNEERGQFPPNNNLTSDVELWYSE